MAIAVLAPIAWLVPQRMWAPLGHVISLAIARLWPGVTRERIATLQRALGARRIAMPLSALRVAIMDGYMEERLQILRAHRPGGWRPRIRLIGREHLDAALAHGRGAVLWNAPFSYADLVTKMALAEAGVAVSHLSAFSRGFSPNSCVMREPSRFGARVLSPLRTRVEDRYLRERLVLPPDGSLAYARTVERRLRANGVLSLRAGDHGHRALDVPLLDGRVRLATGAPSVALSTGATLLPTATVRTGDGAFDVVIGRALAASPQIARRDAIEELVRAYARFLEERVLIQPELWSGWYSLALDGNAEAAPLASTSRMAFDAAR